MSDTGVISSAPDENQIVSPQPDLTDYQNSTRADPDLISLPRECLNLISSYLDQTSLIEVSRTCQFLTYLADQRLWDTLHLKSSKTLWGISTRTAIRQGRGGTIRSMG